MLQIRAYMKAIFAEAVDQDFLPKDPARKVKTPANLRETDKTVLTWERLAAALARLDLRDHILMNLDISNALRPSEPFAFRWKCHRPASLSLTIVETIYKVKIRPCKTKSSLTKIPILQGVSEELLVWRQVCQERYDKRKPQRGKNKITRGLPPSDQEAFMFPGRFGSFMDPSNYRRRVLRNCRRVCAPPWTPFTTNCTRRSTAWRRARQRSTELEKFLEQQPKPGASERRQKLTRLGYTAV